MVATIIEAFSNPKCVNCDTRKHVYSSCDGIKDENKCNNSIAHRKENEINYYQNCYWINNKCQLGKYNDGDCTFDNISEKCQFPSSINKDDELCLGNEVKIIFDYQCDTEINPPPPPYYVRASVPGKPLYKQCYYDSRFEPGEDYLIKKNSCTYNDYEAKCTDSLREFVSEYC